MNDIIYAGKHLLTHAVARHKHAGWELIYCTGGTGRLVFQDQTITYGEGDVLVIPPLVPHSNFSDEGFTNIHLNMQNAVLPFRGPCVVRDDRNRFLLNAFAAAFFHYSSDQPQRGALLSAYGNLIACYLAAYQENGNRSHIVEEIENQIILNYPDCNFELDSYLRSLPFSYDYLRKLFRKELGMTPHQYLSDKRLQVAASMLSLTGKGGNSMSEISALCGFREPLYFSRMFKKCYGVSPSAYAERCAEQPERPADSDSMKIMLDPREP